MLALAQIRSNPVRLTVIFLFLLMAPLCGQAQCIFTNGDFETTDLTGWTIYNRTFNQGNWYNYTGTLTPLSVHNISAPPQGTRGAVTDQNQASTHELYQDFTLPAGQSGTLSFYFYYNNTHVNFVNLNTLDYVGNQQARIDLMRPGSPNESISNNDIWVKLYQTKPGDPLFLSPTILSYDVSGFAGRTTRLRFAEAVGLNYFLVGVDNVCLSTTRGTLTRSTPTGSNVKADFGGAYIVFPSVTAAGNTSLTQLDAAAQTSPPVGDAFVGPAYDFSTTATVTTPISVCLYLPTITDDAAFSHVRLLHKEAGIWVDLPTSIKSTTNRELCAQVTSLSPFTAAISALVPTAAPLTISGAVTSSDGSPLGGVAMQLSGSENHRTITRADGSYSFSVEPGGFYNIKAARANYAFAPGERSMSPTGNVTDAVFTATANTTATVNPLDEDLFFVRQQYLDFLGREPDSGGLAYWDDRLVQCGADQNCLQQQRIGVSAAFYIESEFQQKGSFVYRLYSAALGRRVKFAEFAADRQQVVGGANLEEAKATFVNAFVNREEFQQKYHSSRTADSYVDALLAAINAGAGVDLSAQRQAFIDKYHIGGNINDSRSLVLREAIEQSGFKQAIYNQSFVVMQYFGYLQRNPDAGGFHFWLNVLDQDPGNFRGMVCSFLTSAEYQQRFASVITHSNGECGR
ncbi:MAG: hypothetical protein JWM21_3010 [Acidobacteria bacterium]|nr:hypothetical protein [Acidobacteriota bacterium]